MKNVSIDSQTAKPMGTLVVICINVRACQSSTWYFRPHFNLYSCKI